LAIFYEHGKKYNFRNQNGTPYYRKNVTINGKRHVIYGDGEKDALRKIEEAKNLSNAGLDYDKKSAKVGFTFKYWLFNVKRVDKDIKASSFARYEMSFRLHIEPYDIANMNLSNLSSANLQEYITKMYEEENVSGATIAATFKIWKMFTRWAVDEGYLIKDPCRNISLPGKREKVNRKIEVFSEEERATILAYIDKSHYRYDTIIKLAFATGMRQGELLGLKWSDIGEDSISISRSTAMVTHVDKNGERERYREVWDTKTLNSERVIPILPSTAKMLKEHHKAQLEYFLKNRIPKSDYVFTTDTGNLIDASSFRTSYERMLKRAGVPYRKFHTIRHTFATEAIRRGVDVKDLQMLMGHSDIETTFVYVHSDMDSKRKSIEMMGEILC